MAETIRTFIAIELNDRVKQTIRELQGHLKPLGCDISWVKPENAHLTLKFLGDVKMKMIQPLTETIENLCRNLHPIETGLTQPGVFPDFRHPRIVWVGLNDDDGKLTRLAESLETTLGNIGFKKEKRDFQAHITIGRVKSDKNIHRLTESLENYRLPMGITQNIQDICLYKSVLTGSGPIYSVLASFRLGGPDKPSS